MSRIPLPRCLLSVFHRARDGGETDRTTSFEEDPRDACLIRWLSNLAQDLRYAFRTYRKNPGFVAVVVLTLMLGIGVNVALFTLFNTFVLRAPPVGNPERLVTIGLRSKPVPGQRGWRLIDYHQEYPALQKNDRVFENVACWLSTMVVSPFGIVSGRLVSANYFALLGGRMALGRPFAEEENRVPDAYPLVVLSHRTWERRLQGDPAIIGKTVRLAGQSFTVIGVTEAGFGGLDVDVPDFWAPLMMYRVLLPGNELVGVNVVGRLRRGVSLEQARAATLALVGPLSPDKPIANVTVTSRERLGELDKNTATMYTPIAAIFGIVLLIACANVANLMLARAAARRREIGMRLALGASRGRLVQQLLTESAVLALAGGLLGVPFSQFLVRTIFNAVMSMFPFGLGATEFVSFRVDLRVLFYVLLVSLATSVFFGLVPALQSTRRDLASAMKDDTGGTTAGIRGLGPRDRLVVIQLALCLVLLITAGLLLLPVVKAQAFDPGFETAHLLSVTFTRRSLDESGPEVALANIQLRMALAERLRHRPNVTGVSISRGSVLGGGAQTTVVVDGRVRDTGSYFVTPEFFTTHQIPILRGRNISPGESAGEAAVAIVSEATAAAFWPGQNPLGKQLDFRPEPRPPSAAANYRRPRAGPAEVIGVARNVAAQFSAEGMNAHRVYVPTRVDDPSNWWLVVRFIGDSRQAKDIVRAELAAIDPDAIPEIHSMSEPALTIAMKMMPGIGGMLGLMGLFVAVVGLYGVMSYLVVQRTQEIGIRMALGAQRGSVLWLVLWQGLRLALTGAFTGMVLAAALCRLLRAFMHEMRSFDLATFTLVPVLLVSVCLVATFVPARRATHFDPLVALRHE